ncbi:MAG: phage protein GemA/Gp16 family protein [Pseudomonadota bacterium]
MAKKKTPEQNSEDELKPDNRLVIDNSWVCNRQQRDLIVKLLAALDLSEREFLANLMLNFGVQSEKLLSEKQADELIYELERTAIERGLLEKYQGKYEILPASCEGIKCLMSTMAQKEKIEEAWKSICKIERKDIRKAALRMYLGQVYHVSDLNFLTRQQAENVLKNLKGLATYLEVMKQMRKKADEDNI